MEEDIITSPEKKKRGEKTERNDLAPERRLAICRSCPIYVFETGVCNPGRWISRKGPDVSKVAKEGYVRGCGCLVSRKVLKPDSHCNAGRW